LLDIATRIDGSEASKSLKSSSGKMLLILAIVGLLSIVGINFVFFKGAQKTLKDRKLI
jgi:hypothetical protein